MLQKIIFPYQENSIASEKSTTILNSKEIGRYASIGTEKSIWHNGATYITGQNDSDDNNSPIILKYLNGAIQNTLVGQLTNYDVSEHPRPSILIYNDFIYIIVINGHGEDMLIFKSNTAESIVDGFTLHKTIAGNYGYVNAILTSDNRMVILTRSTNAPVNYSHIILVSDVADFTTFTEKLVTDADHSTTNVRHYPCIPTHYGINNWYYFGVQMRYDSGSSGYTYKQCMYKTQDFNLYYNLPETVSKNISLGKITHAELLSDFSITTPTDTSKSSSGINGIILNDELYSLYYNYTSSLWKWIHIDRNGVITETTDTIITQTPTIGTVSPTTMYYNGRNLVHILYGVLYTSNLDFTNFKLVGTVNKNKILPSNLNEVEGFYIIGGSNVAGEFYYNITDSKFYN